MKATFLLLFVVVPLAGLAAENPPPADAVPFAWVEPDDPAAALIRRTGEQVINKVGTMLIYEVQHSLANQGLAKTLEVAHLKNFELPKPEPGQPRVTAIKRTSLSIREPANLPDIPDRAALDKINTALEEGDTVPPVLIQRLAPAGAPVEWRVYRPITTMPQCLNCHGPREYLQPEVRAFLDQHYPDDKATGYTANKWRGLIRVSLAEAGPVAPTKATGRR